MSLLKQVRIFSVFLLYIGFYLIFYTYSQDEITVSIENFTVVEENETNFLSLYDDWTFENATEDLQNVTLPLDLITTVKPFIKQNTDIPIMDDEWGVETKKMESELPQTFTEKYNLMANNAFTTIRFFFNTAKDNLTSVVHFNFTEIKTKESLIDAELYIFKYKRKPEILRIYQILENGFEDSVTAMEYPDMHKLLSTTYFDFNHFGWQIFKIKETVQKWLSLSEKNLGLLISSTDNKDKNKIMPDFIYERTKTYKYRAFTILSYSRNKKIGRRTFQKYHKSKQDNVGISDEGLCALRKMHVDFDENGWSNFIIQPNGFDAYNCLGSCTDITKGKFTNHGKLLKMLQNQNFSNYCVPLSYSSFPIMFYDVNENVVIKMYDNIVVNECGCR